MNVSHFYCMYFFHNESLLKLFVCFFSVLLGGEFVHSKWLMTSLHDHSRDSNRDLKGNGDEQQNGKKNKMQIISISFN